MMMQPGQMMGGVSPIFVQENSVQISTDRGSGSKRDLKVFGPPNGYMKLGHSGHGGKIWCVSVARFQAMPKGPRSPVKMQVGYQNVWSHRRSGMCYSVWEPVAPQGYVPVGIHVKFGAHDLNPPNKVTLCVRADLVKKCGRGRRVWTDGGSGAQHDLNLGECLESGLLSVNKSTTPQYHPAGIFCPTRISPVAAVVQRPGVQRPGVSLYQNAMVGGRGPGMMGGRPGMMGPRPMGPRPMGPRPMMRGPVRRGPMMGRGASDMDGDGIPDHMQGPRPGYGGSRPMAQGPRPGYGGSRPMAQGPRPGYGGSRPMTQGPRPGYGGSRPGYGGSRPGYGGSQGPRPGYGGSRPMAQGPRPGYGGSRPMAQGARPGYGSRPGGYQAGRGY